ncbi:hypothetical protein DV735_g1064, partial [Chaetothyriales sp. CBS 134920]
MNAMHPFKDPAAGVAVPLLPHMHLISKHRYPIINNYSLETIVGYLLEAPKIMRDLQPVQWQFIDAPPDGTIFLAWQPLEYMATTMASDGYIWADPEHVAKSEMHGYTLEIYMHRSGYRPQAETMATHARRRYRLLPSQPGLPSPDPSLFIVHYSKANPRDAIHAARIPPLPPVVQQMQQRSIIQASGQLIRKDFMLHDRANWPHIQAPPALARAVAASGPPGHRRGPSIAHHPEPTLEEEEDVSRGDALDFMTPRDISKTRYEQHHEWMEEVLESPYSIFQIIPGDLGLGRKGELEALTRGFFDAPMTAQRDVNATPGAQDSVGRLGENDAAEFKKRAEEKIQSMNAELEKMRKTHARRMQRLQKTTLLNIAEKKLRSVPTALNERTASIGAVAHDETDALDEIAKEVEEKTGRKIEKVSAVRLVSRGGLEDRVLHRSLSTSSTGRPVVSPSKSQAVPAAVSQAPLQQLAAQNGVPNSHPQPHILSAVPQSLPHPSEGQSTPRDDDQEQGQDQSMAEEALNAGTGSPAVNYHQTGDEGEIPALDDLDMDVDLSGLDDQGQDDAVTGDASDWIMVDEQQAAESKAEDAHGNAPPQSQPPPAAAGGAPQRPPAQQPADANTEQQHAAGTGDFDVGTDFDNVDVDTAGDALAGYEPGNDEELNLDDMDDNFGDAFQS